MTRIKICGVTEPAYALVAVEAGADFIGLNFAPSHRRVTLSKAKAIAEAVREFGEHRPKLVGVFVNAEPREINHIAIQVGLDMAQLSGDEDQRSLSEIERPVIKAVHVPPGPVEEHSGHSLRTRLAVLRDRKAIPLLDTKVPGKAGGTGRSFEWEVATELAREFYFLLAGGLTPQNVAEAVATVRPWAVDVSSGVETNGVKDPQKIRDFVRAVREAEAATGPQQTG